MLVKKNLRNGKVSVTSSYFEDIRMVKQSLFESKKDDYVPGKWRREKGRDFSELEVQTVLMTFQLAKKGLAEINDFVEDLKPSQYDKFVINYGPWKNYESYETLEKIRDELLEKGKYNPLEEEDAKELERVQKELKDIDDFVERNLVAAVTED